MNVDTVFTWDPEKAKRNERVHGVSFETAKEAFGDPHQVTVESYFLEDQGEQRQALIGMTQGLTLVFAVFVDRSSPRTEIVHIVSARKAESYERKIYSAHLQNRNQ